MSEDGDHFVPIPWSVNHEQLTIKDLLNRRCRIIRPDTQVTTDFMPERVNIYLDEHSAIQDIRFG